MINPDDAFLEKTFELKCNPFSNTQPRPEQFFYCVDNLNCGRNYKPRVPYSQTFLRTSF